MTSFIVKTPLNSFKDETKVRSLRVFHIYYLSPVGMHYSTIEVKVIVDIGLCLLLLLTPGNKADLNETIVRLVGVVIEVCDIERNREPLGVGRGVAAGNTVPPFLMAQSLELSSTIYEVGF